MDVVDRFSGQNLDEVLDGLLRRDPPGHIVAIGENGLFVPMPSAVPLTGQTVITGGTSALDLVTPEHIEAVIDTWERARREGYGYVTVNPVVAPEIDVNMHFVDARHRYGVFLGVLLGAPAATGAPEPAESSLRPRYGVSRKNELAVFIACDESFCRMLGRSPEELIGRRSLEFVHPADHARAIANYMDLIAHPGTARRVRLRHRHADGSWVWMEITNTNLLNDPAQACVLGETVDISEEMAASEALRANEELLRRLTEALPVGVLQLDAEGRVVYRNDRLEGIVGASVPIGEDMRAVLAGTPGHVEPVLLQRVLTEGGDGEREAPIRLPDGTERRVQIILRSLSGPDGERSGVIACVSDVTEAAQLREELARQATYDALTGCLTRRALLDRLDATLASGAPVTALFIDLDGFKPVNDRLGHAVGDQVLREIGARLLHHVGEDGMAGRIGGDEFLVVTTRPGGPSEAQALADALQRALAAPMDLDGTVLAVGASIGVALADGTADADALVAAADERMYQAKSASRPG